MIVASGRDLAIFMFLGMICGLADAALIASRPGESNLIKSGVFKVVLFQREIILTKHEIETGFIITSFSELQLVLTNDRMIHQDQFS